MGLPNVKEMRNTDKEVRVHRSKKDQLLTKLKRDPRSIPLSEGTQWGVGFHAKASTREDPRYRKNNE